MRQVRLSDADLRHIRETFQPIVRDTPGALWLYGSRTDPNARGGDIDLMLILEDEDIEPQQQKKSALLVELKSRLGDQRIDLRILTRTQAATDPFCRVALPEAILLLPC